MVSLDSCLKNVNSAAIAGHVRPDGDSVGSCLAVYNYIIDNYPDIRVDIFLDPIPDKFLFLKNADRISDPGTVAPETAFDVFFSLDCGDEDRLGGAYPFFESASHTVCVDHHLTNESFADINEVYPDSSSTCELIYGMLDADRITEPIAECLYVGIALDTGIFRYPCTSSETMRIAGELMEKGIPFQKIVDDIFYIRTFPQQQIRGRAFVNSRLVLDGKCIVSVVTFADLEDSCATAEDLDEIVSELRSTEGVEVSVFLYETDEGYKISLRSASYVDVAAVAKEFGGGGHARAAGASFVGKPDEILKDLIPMIEKQI